MGRLILVAAGALLLGGCGGDDSPTGSDGGWARPGILRGDWVAARMEHRPQSNPTIVVVDDRTFTLSVTSAGDYVATLSPGAVERGLVRVVVPSVIFRPTDPPGADDPATLEQKGDTLILVGDSVFDFDGNEVEEPSVLTITLVPR